MFVVFVSCSDFYIKRSVAAAELCKLCTCSGPEPQAPQQAARQPVAVPDGELHTDLRQVGLVDPVVHHRVVKHGIHGSPKDTSLLAAFPAGVRQHKAWDEGKVSRLATQQMYWVVLLEKSKMLTF